MASAPLKTNTRLITVDVVATDSHGSVVRGLTKNDFKVYLDHGVQQDIARFKFVDARMRQTTVAKNAASGEYSNLNAAGGIRESVFRAALEVLSLRSALVFADPHDYRYKLV